MVINSAIKKVNTNIDVIALLTTYGLNLKTKIKFLQIYIFTTHGVESRTFIELTSKKLEACAIWLTNKHVLKQLNKQTEVVKSMKRILEYLALIIRNSQRYELLQLILECKVRGKRCPARRNIVTRKFENY